MATIKNGILSLAPDEHWSVAAKCGNDPEAMYPGDKDHAGIAEAKELCRTCPVISECLENALRMGDWHGIQGGMTPDERRALVNRDRQRRFRERVAA